VFSKILIANRGEIACRVMRTARRMGIECVAVYSEADENALHVRMADQAVAIGPAPAAESYLAIENILKAVHDTGAEAVHPGYGFLAENAAFAEALEGAGVAFIGPGAAAIAAMGDKLESKRLAREAGLVTIPGHDALPRDAGEAAKIARKLGYPVMLKALAGGGGKGMRIARNDAEAREGFYSAASEARSSFGDDRVLVEKFVEGPRHIEIQLLADGHGNVVHLGERECSIQRRFQKIVEEAPSPLLDGRTRAAMGAQAVALARAVGYRSAGTVEFIVDSKNKFYFLEMNTRLQVEHTVTEMVSGLDLVEQMIRIAAGEPLAFGQQDIRLDGWAIEGRVYAEDPSRGFLPSPGRLLRYRPPPEAEGIRLDDGVYEGAEVSVFYDPLIAKLCASGPTREVAIARMRAALDAFEIRGLRHNLGFLAALMRHPRFVAGRLGVGFVAEEYADGFHGAPAEGEVLDVLIGVAVLVHVRAEARASRNRGQAPRQGSRPQERWVVSLDGAPHPVAVSEQAGGVDVELDGRRLAVRGAWADGATPLAATVDGRDVTVQVERRSQGYRLSHAGSEAFAVVRRPRAAELAALMPVKSARGRKRVLLSPMPGRVISIAVRAGQEVKAGEPLAVVDAMKMENVLRAERDGRIARVAAAAGDSLSADQLIIEFE
jgi:propionyl-CoA carboxylase alpha chain